MKKKQCYDIFSEIKGLHFVTVAIAWSIVIQIVYIQDKRLNCEEWCEKNVAHTSRARWKKKEEKTLHLKSPPNPPS